MQNIYNRISKIIDNEGITVGALEKKIGASKGVLSRAMAKGTDISMGWIVSLVENFPGYSTEWLLRGEGAMKKAESAMNEPLKSFNHKGDKKRKEQLIPLYDVKATAGIVELLTHQNQQKHIPIDFISIPNLPKCDGALPITGDSMYPLLKSGDIVLYKEVRDFNNIIWGEMYLVAISHNGDDFFFAKYIQRADTEGFVRLVSQNRHHQDKEFPLGSIRALALIKASIRINTGF